MKLGLPTLITLILCLIAGTQACHHCHDHSKAPDQTKAPHHTQHPAVPAAHEPKPTHKPTKAPFTERPTHPRTPRPTMRAPSVAPVTVTDSPTESPTDPPTKAPVALKDDEGDETATDGAPTSSDLDQDVVNEEGESEEGRLSNAEESVLKEEVGEIKEEAREDFITGLEELIDYANRTDKIDEFEAWFNGDEMYPNQTIPPGTCEDKMADTVQTYWDLLYSMVAMAILTIVFPYLFSCCMDRHSFSVMRCISTIYYISGALHAISGLLLSTALMPQCPAACGEFFCNLQQYNPGPVFGVVIFFVGVLWFLKGMTLQCRANKAEREYIFSEHLKMGGTADAEIGLTAAQQHEARMESAAQRSLKPATRPPKLGELI